MAEVRTAMGPFDSMDGVYEPLDWEFVRFDAVDAGVQVTVQGLACATDVRLISERGRLALYGRWAPHLREFRVQEVVDAAGCSVVGSLATAWVDGMRPGDLPVVHADDPTHPDLPKAFLHQRADRWAIIGDLDDILVA